MLGVRNWRFTVHRLAPAVLIVLVGAAVLALLVFPPLTPNALIARHWCAQLATMPDEQVLAQVRRIAALGDAGIAVLVEVLASPRASVADAVRIVLREQIGRWEVLPSSQSSSKVALLARHLADHAKTYDPAGQVFAGDLATQILLWPIDRETVDSTQLIAHCETVLRCANVHRRKTIAARLGPTKRSSQNGAGGLADGAASPPPANPAADSMESSSRPLGDDLPAAMIDVRRPAPPLDDAQGVAPQTDPKLLLNGAANASAGPQQLSPTSVRRIPSNGDEQANGGQIAESTPDREDQRSVVSSLVNLDALVVMRYLHSADSPTMFAATEELTRRGFSPADVLLAQRLTHPDPPVRLALAKQLPRMSGVDARPWLLWLAQDSDAAVRREAIAILATSRDPNVQQQVRELAERGLDAGLIQGREKR